jgi:hypothetical protein
MSINPEQSSKDALVSLVYKVDDISAKGISDCLQVNTQNCEAIAKTLDLLSLDSMKMEFKLHRSGRSRFKLKGQLLADATQSCVVTLDPIKCKIDQEIDIDFWPPEDVAQLETKTDDEEMEVLLDGPEPIIENSIDVGQIAYEHFAAALDPYPRTTGVSFDWNNPQIDQESESGNKPFAKLARLKELKRKIPD